MRVAAWIISVAFVLGSVAPVWAANQTGHGANSNSGGGHGGAGVGNQGNGGAHGNAGGGHVGGNGGGNGGGSNGGNGGGSSTGGGNSPAGGGSSLGAGSSAPGQGTAPSVGGPSGDLSGAQGAGKGNTIYALRACTAPPTPGAGLVGYTLRNNGQFNYYGYEFSLPDFSKCMKDKGYKLDTAGRDELTNFGAR